MVVLKELDSGEKVFNIIKGIKDLKVLNSPKDFLEWSVDFDYKSIYGKIIFRPDFVDIQVFNILNEKRSWKISEQLYVEALVSDIIFFLERSNTKNGQDRL